MWSGPGQEELGQLGPPLATSPRWAMEGCPWELLLGGGAGPGLGWWGPLPPMRAGLRPG